MSLSNEIPIRSIQYEDPEDASCLRRLKEIAIQNQDRDSALQFNAQKLQAERHYSITNPFALLLESIYRIFSDYGRSIARPVITLAALWFVCAALYSLIDPKIALSYSAKQIFPLLSNLQDACKDYFVSNGLQLFVAFAQNILSLILLFLLGLGLRNRFKL